jgi:gamma-glutamyltranspeptidase/glutathione hydrolase
VFYKGAIAKAIADDMERRHGLLALKDLADHHADWIDPISTTYRGYRVLELPPNTQGVTTLEMLNIMEGFDLKSLGFNSAAYLHTLVEAKRIAFADRGEWIGDRSTTPEDAIARMLSKDYAAARRKEINPDKAAPEYTPLALEGRATPESLPDPVGRGDTVYLTAADSDGNVISLIQSLYETFGSGIVAGDRSVPLRNLFAAPGHPDRSRRANGRSADSGGDERRRPWVSFGVMGATCRRRGTLLANPIDFGMNIQDAGEAPLFRHSGAGVGTLALESAFTPAARAGLTSRGHHIAGGTGLWGGFQGIMIDSKNHVLMAGSDPRKDGMAAGW